MVLGCFYSDELGSVSVSFKKPGGWMPMLELDWLIIGLLIIPMLWFRVNVSMFCFFVLDLFRAIWLFRWVWSRDSAMMLLGLFKVW